MLQFAKMKTFVVFIGFILIIAGFVSSAISDQEANSDEKGNTQMNEKVIKGVDRLQWGKQQENTFMGALNVTMKALGEDVNYDYLMGVSVRRI